MKTPKILPIAAGWMPVPEELCKGAAEELLGISEWHNSRGGFSVPIVVSTEGRVFLGQQGEDLEVYLDYFKDRDVDNGWVMEMGAGEGIAHSNSFYFTKCEGWSGLLVEPSTKAFHILQLARSESITANTAIGRTEGTCHLHVDELENHRSFVEGELPPDLEPTHLPAVTTSEEVSMTTLTELVGRVKVPHVDVFFLDVEGSELAVLEGWDWSVPIYVMVIEMFDSITDEKTLQEYTKIRSILTEQGYVFNKRVKSNEVWHLPLYRDGSPTLLREKKND